MTNYELKLPFDSDSPEFTRGVEVGRIYEKLQVGYIPFMQYVHVENAEMCMRLAEVFDVKVTAKAVDDQWMVVTYEE